MVEVQARVPWKLAIRLRKECPGAPNVRGNQLWVPGVLSAAVSLSGPGLCHMPVQVTTLQVAMTHVCVPLIVQTPSRAVIPPTFGVCVPLVLNGTHRKR